MCAMNLQEVAMEPNVQKAFEFTRDVVTQQMTIATGVIVITITLLKDVLRLRRIGIHWLKLSWILYLVSIAFGLITQMKLATLLQMRSYDIFEADVFGAFQAFPFFFATVSVVVYGWKALSQSTPPDPLPSATPHSKIWTRPRARSLR